MANSLYNKGRQAFGNALVSWTSDTIKCALVSSTYSPDLAAHQYLSDLGGNVISTAQPLLSKTNVDGVMNASSVTFPLVASGSTVGYIAIYKDTGNPSTSNLILLIDTSTGLPFSTNGSNIVISWDTGPNKIFKL